MKFSKIIALVCALGLLFASGTTMAQAECFPAPDGLVSWWPGDGDYGDFSGDSPGAAEGALTFGTGIVDEAFDFSSGMVRISNQPDLEPQNLTIDAWVFARSAGSLADNIGPIIVAMDLGNQQPGISYALTGPGINGNFRASVGLTDSTDPAVVSTHSFAFNEFHHVAMTWDGITIRLYVNGLPEGALSLGPRTVLYQGTDMGIGRHPFFGTRHFDGLIDEVTIYDQALSVTEIQAIYDAGAAGKCKAEVVSCVGFEPPMANPPVTVKKNRALPLKAEVFDADGYAMTDVDFVSPPVVQVWFDGEIINEGLVEVESLSAGHGDEGNQFVFTDDDKWQFNLKTNNYTASGSYTIFMESGDSSEYVFEPLCETVFVVK